MSQLGDSAALSTHANRGDNVVKEGNTRLRQEIFPSPDPAPPI